MGFLDHFSNTSLSGSLCWLLAISVCQKVQPWSSQYPVPVSQCSQGSRLSLGHQHLGERSTASPGCCHPWGTAMPLALLRTAVGTRHLQALWQELSGRRRQGSLNTSTCATTGRCHPRGWGPSAEADPGTSLPLSPSAPVPEGHHAGWHCRMCSAVTPEDQTELQRESKHCEMGGKLHGWWGHQVRLGNYCHYTQK